MRMHSWKPILILAILLPSFFATTARAAAPSITSLTLTSGAVGASVTITGTTFGSSQGSSTVKFNGTTATVTSWSDTSIGVPVPVGATTGNVVVHVGGVDSNGVTFTIVPAPSITSLAPASGAVGVSVTIAGSNFGSSQGSSTVNCNGTTSTATSWSSTSIVTTVPAGATTGNVVVHASGVDSNGATFTVAPSLSSLSPQYGASGDSVTISGSNFGAAQGMSAVSFNGTLASPTSWSSSTILAPVPAAASTGPVSVTVQGMASNGLAFTVTPTISGASPNSGAVGTLVTITGSGFGPTQGTTTITFNGTTGVPRSWTNTTIQVPVPWGASSGSIIVTVSGFFASNNFAFTVIPSLSGLSPAFGLVGTSVTVSGQLFGTSQGTSTVTFNGVLASVSTWSGTSIVATVPSGASTGPVVVTVGGASSNGPQFTVPPTITSISPTSGPAGTPVTISGTSFGGTAGLVTFNGVAATSPNWGPSKIIASMPSGATTGPVVVTLGAFSSNGVTFTVGTGSITGTVTRASDGTAISGALVEALQSNATVASATTAANGTYAISSLIPGVYDVRVSASGFGTSALMGYNVVASVPVTVNAALFSPGSIAGKITRSDGITAIIGASVTVFQASDTVGTASTDSAGNYTISSVSPGSFTVQASATGFTAQSQTGVSVTVGNAETVNLSLPGQSAF